MNNYSFQEKSIVVLILLKVILYVFQVVISRAALVFNDVRKYLKIMIIEKFTYFVD